MSPHARDGPTECCSTPPDLAITKQGDCFIMVIERLAPSNQSRSIIVGPRLRAKLRRELNALVLEWNFATRRRRAEITKVAYLIVDLLDDGDQS
jgi:hypothetical protein